MKRLYIIGNGFDICHGIDSRYSDFQKFAYNKIGYVASQMEIFYPYLSSSNGEWYDVESALGKIDPRATYEECNEDFEIDYDHMMRSAAYLEDNPKILLEQYLRDFHHCFEEWVQAIDINFVEKDSRFNFQSDDLFFTFNYTDTLETVYGIEEKNINHIHGNRLKGEEPVLGFGSDCEHIFEPSESDTTYEENSYQFICEVANEEEKDTASIIALNEKYGYWKTLNGIDYVIVIGHSYSTVDISYFDKISHSVSVGANWHLYCYTAEDRCRATEMMKIIGVSKYELL